MGCSLNNFGNIFNFNVSLQFSSELNNIFHVKGLKRFYLYFKLNDNIVIKRLRE